MDYIPKYFIIHELMSREDLAKLSQRVNWEQIAWQIFDPRILQVADLIRKRYGKMVCNTWHWGGVCHYRGWRSSECTVGTEYSQHRFGRAIDLIPVEVVVEEIRKDIKAGENFHWITCIEQNVSWLHVDCRNYKGLLLV